MTTFKVSPEDLQSFGGRMYQTASALFTVAGGTLGSPNSGWPGLDDAVGDFASHWGSTLDVIGQDLSELADKVTAAANAYAAVECEITKAAG